MKARALFVRLLLLVEGLLTFPVFLASWFVCAIGAAAVAGYRFAQAEDDDAKAGGLLAMLGERKAK